MHVDRYKKFYANEVLKPEVHHRLVVNAEAYADDAGIRVTDIYDKFRRVCKTDAEWTWINVIARNAVPDFSGLYYLSSMDPPIIDRMRALVGACVRNFVRAKLVTQGRLFDMIIDNTELDDYRVLCLPDLMHGSGNVSEGLRRSVSTMFLDRYVAGHQICLGKIGSLKHVETLYGSDVSDCINSHFLAVGNGQ